jgi:hypothetical protein
MCQGHEGSVSSVGMRQLDRGCGVNVGARSWCALARSMAYGVG